VTAERRGTLNEFVQDLEALNLGSLVLQLNGQVSSQQLKDSVIRAIVRNEKAAEPSLATLHETLAGHRHTLLEHVRSLHNVRSRWNCSPYQAMQSLAGLTALTRALDHGAAQAQRARQHRDRNELAARLKRAAGTGSFSRPRPKARGTAPAAQPQGNRARPCPGLDLARDIPLLRRQGAACRRAFPHHPRQDVQGMG
jgi:hypothetical protein